MFIEKLKEEKLRKKYEEQKKVFREVIKGGGDPSKTGFTERPKDESKPFTYTIPLSGTKTIAIEESIEAQNVVIPYKIMEHFVKISSNRFIMNFCMCREAMECKDYPIDLGCLFMGEPVKDIHPELGHLADVDEALVHIKKLKDAGFIFNTGHVPADSRALGIGPSNRIMTICACCPCCCITKILPNTKPGARKLPGLEIHVTEDCIGCGECLDACVYGYIQLEDEKAVTSPLCIGCGRCADACPENAIEVKVTDPTYIEKAVENLGRAVDVT